MATQIVVMLKKAWENFCRYYDDKAPHYRDNWLAGLTEKEATKQAPDLHWICWNEYDLMFHIGRFFYAELSKNKKFSNVEMHFEKNISSANFSHYEFGCNLEKLKKRLKRQRVPKVDLIVACEDARKRFLLCAEAKYFRYSRQYNAETPIDKINADIEKLTAIRDLKIAEKVVFVLFDDYDWRHDKRTASEIKQRLEEIARDGITVLSHTSERKIGGMRTATH